MTWHGDFGKDIFPLPPLDHFTPQTESGNRKDGEGSGLPFLREWARSFEGLGFRSGRRSQKQTIMLKNSSYSPNGSLFWQIILFTDTYGQLRTPESAKRPGFRASP